MDDSGTIKSFVISKAFKKVLHGPNNALLSLLSFSTRATSAAADIAAAAEAKVGPLLLLLPLPLLKLLLQLLWLSEPVLLLMKLLLQLLWLSEPVALVLNRIDTNICAGVRQLQRRVEKRNDCDFFLLLFLSRTIKIPVLVWLLRRLLCLLLLLLLLLNLSSLLGLIPAPRSFIDDEEVARM